MINNPGTMGQQIPPSASHNQIQLATQAQQPPSTATAISQMMHGGTNSAANLQARQNHNDDILARCPIQTQRLRDSLQGLLNSTKQAAQLESDEQTSSSLSSSSSSTTTATNLSASATLRNNIDRKLYDMSTSLEQLSVLLDQYDFKFIQNQLQLINHYIELSFEKQGTLMDEWSSNIKWTNKLFHSDRISFHKRQGKL